MGPLNALLSRDNRLHRHQMPPFRREIYFEYQTKERRYYRGHLELVNMSKGRERFLKSGGMKLSYWMR